MELGFPDQNPFSNPYRVQIQIQIQTEEMGDKIENDFGVLHFYRSRLHAVRIHAWIQTFRDFFFKFRPEYQKILTMNLNFRTFLNILNCICILHDKINGRAFIYLISVLFKKPLWRICHFQVLQNFFEQFTMVFIVFALKSAVKFQHWISTKKCFRQTWKRLWVRGLLWKIYKYAN